MTSITRRRLLHGAAASSTLLGAGWFLFPSADADPFQPVSWCPSDEELESQPWIRGRLKPFEQTVTTAETVNLTLVTRNSGGEPGEVDQQLYPERQSDASHSPEEYLTEKAVRALEVTVPPNTTIREELSLAAPTEPGEYVYSIDRLGSSCDLIAPAEAMVKVLPSEENRLNMSD